MWYFTRSCGWVAALALAVTLSTARAASAESGASETRAAVQAMAEEAQETEASGDPNPLNFRTDLAIWTFVVFVLLFAILRAFAWPQIAAAIDERERKIAAEIAAAAQKNEDAKRLLAEYDLKLAAAAGEVRALLDEARRDAEHTKNSIVAEARKAAEGERDRALIEINRAKEGAIHDLAERTATIAIDLAKEVTRKDLSTERNNELVREALTKLQPSKN